MNKSFGRKSVLFIFLLFISGSPSSFAYETVAFHGSLDFDKQDFSLSFNLGQHDILKARASQMEEKDFHLKLDVDHLKTPIFELSSEIESLIAVLNKEHPMDTKIYGKLWSKYSILNYKPIRELSGDFEFEGGRVELKNVIFGSMECNGYFEIFPPFKADITFSLTDVPMEDFLAFWTGQSLYEASGKVSGDIRLSGNFRKPLLRGNLLSQNGLIKELKYRTMKLNIEGVYPAMEISQSFISQADGLSFSFSGPINLSDKNNFKKQIKALALVPMVRDSSDKVEWTIRRLDETEGASTEIKYLKMKNAGDSPFSFGNSDMLGVERSVDF